MNAPVRTQPDTAKPDLAAAIRAEAAALGFIARFAAIPDVWAASGRLEAFIAAGYHGEMAWMEETLERRRHPQGMWPEARSALVVGCNYGPDGDPLTGLARPDTANLSVYARGDDYHELIKGRLKQLAGWIVSKAGCDLKVFVDTAPLMEKPLGQLAGIGWQGKHTNLVSRDYGSWLFLGVILLDRDTTFFGAKDAPEIDHCGSCRACLDICPTDAFIGPYQLDARACLSYLTIELKGPWPERFRHQMGNRVYGCDDCLAVCPWNKFAQATREIRLQTRDGFGDLKLVDLARLDDASFRQLFRKSPVKRIGRVSFLRNVHYAMGNALKVLPNPAMTAALQTALDDPDAVVRGSAVWALKQGLDADAFATLSTQRLPYEADFSVRSEWEGRP